MTMRSLPVLLLLLLGMLASCDKPDEDTASTMIKPVFESDRQEISAGDSITFKDFSEGYATKWKWTFEGGTPATSDLSSPVVKYNTPGMYSVTVEVSNGKTTETLTKTEYIRVDYNQVKADFNTPSLVVFTAQAIQFKDSSAGRPDTWLWEFVPVNGGAALTSTEQNPTITFSDTGYYNVSLTASNPSYTNKKTKENFLRVIDINAVSTDFGSDETATYAGGSIHFADRSLGFITSWQWSITGPETMTSTQQDPVINFTLPGRYSVSLTASNGTKTVTKEIENYILVVPSESLGAFLPFNGNAHDVGPNAISTTSVGAGVTFGNTDRKGQQGNVAAFNGATGVMITGHSAHNFGTKDYSVSCWVRTPVTTRMMVWQESGKGGSLDNGSWLRIGDNTTTQLMRFNTEDATGASILNLGSASRVSDGQWHHVVAIRQGLVMSVYIDGVKSGSLTATVLKTVSNGGNFKIGIQEGPTSNSNFFNGDIDDVIIYNKALNEAEVLELFNL